MIFNEFIKSAVSIRIHRANNNEVIGAWFQIFNADDEWADCAEIIHVFGQEWLDSKIAEDASHETGGRWLNIESN